MQQQAIAVVGLSARFPGLESTGALWRALCNGHRAQGEGGPGWRDHPLFEATRDKPPIAYTRDVSLLEDLDRFDWRAFRVSPKEAARLDPQQRLLLEQVVEALDVAGLPLAELRGKRVGVYVAAMWDDFLRLYTQSTDQIDGYTISGASRAFLANRISFTFDFIGPSVTVDAACASSLVAVHQAARALAADEIDFAVVGGASVILSADSMGMMCGANVLSREGTCRPLDAAGDGFLRTEGCCAVVLQRANDVDAGQRVFARLIGSAIGHNGRSDWIMAPDAHAQARVLNEALGCAGVSPARLRYVEMHGTGFARGDAVELQGIVEVVRGHADEACSVGTLKGNLGHAEAAAGLASLIKVCLAASYGVVPATIAPRTWNPALHDLARWLCPVFEPQPWQGGVAAVTATSYGGTNAALVLEAVAPLAPAHVADGYLLLVSAADGALLTSVLLDAGEQLARGESAAHDLCYAYARSRASDAQRAAVIAPDVQGLSHALREPWQGAGNQLRDRYAADDGGSDPLRRLAARFLSAERFAFHRELTGCMTLLPARRYQRERLWPRGLPDRSGRSSSASVLAAAAPPALSVQESPVRDRAALASKLARCHPSQRERTLVRELVAAMGRILELGEGHLPAPGAAFFDVGMNSIAMVELRQWLQESFGREFGVSDLLSCSTPRELARYVLALQFATPHPLPAGHARPAHEPITLRAGAIDVERRLIERLERLGM